MNKLFNKKHPVIQHQLRGKIGEFNGARGPADEYKSTIDEAKAKAFLDSTKLRLGGRWAGLTHSWNDIAVIEKGVLAVVNGVLAKLGGNTTTGLKAHIVDNGDGPGSLMCVTDSHADSNLGKSRFFIHLLTREIFESPKYDNIWKAEHSAVYATGVYYSQPTRLVSRNLVMSADRFQLVHVERGSDGGFRRVRYTMPLNYHFRPIELIRTVLGLASHTPDAGASAPAAPQRPIAPLPARSLTGSKPAATMQPTANGGASRTSDIRASVAAAPQRRIAPLPARTSLKGSKAVASKQPITNGSASHTSAARTSVTAASQRRIAPIPSKSLVSKATTKSTKTNGIAFHSRDTAANGPAAPQRRIAPLPARSSSSKIETKQPPTNKSNFEPKTKTQRVAVPTQRSRKLSNTVAHYKGTTQFLQALRAAIVGYHQFMEKNPVVHGDIDVHSVRLHPQAASHDSIVKCAMLVDTGKAKSYVGRDAADSGLWLGRIDDLVSFYQVLYKVVFDVKTSDKKTLENSLSTEPNLEKVSGASWGKGVRELVREMFDIKKDMLEREIVKTTEPGELVDIPEFFQITSEFCVRAEKAIDKALRVTGLDDGKSTGNKNVEVAENARVNGGTKTTKANGKSDCATEAMGDDAASRARKNGAGVKKGRVSLGELEDNIKEDPGRKDAGPSKYRGLSFKKNKRAFDGDDEERKDKRPRNMD